MYKIGKLHVISKNDVKLVENIHKMLHIKNRNIISNR